MRRGPAAASLASVTRIRALLARLLSWGVPSEGWYAVLTGLALLVAARMTGSAADTDPAAPYVTVVLVLAGAWQVERGLRAELRRRPRSAGRAS